MDEIVRELDRFSAMAQGDKDAFEGEQFPALIHFISELKKEKKNQSWEKVENFAKISKENLKLLEENKQKKMQNKKIQMKLAKMQWMYFVTFQISCEQLTNLLKQCLLILNLNWDFQ
ncbi:MAG: hypothetical protein ACTSQK_04435 [Candidatus Heimdallarchaeota archaeon]